jgi:hypothetical protein
MTEKAWSSFILVRDDVCLRIQGGSQASNQQDAGFKRHRALYSTSFLRPAGGLLCLHFSHEKGESKWCRTTEMYDDKSQKNPQCRRRVSQSIFHTQTYQNTVYTNGNAIPVWGCEASRLPHFLDNQLREGGKVVSRTRQEYFWYQGHSAAGRIRSTKKSNEIIRNRTRDLPACSLVPQLRYCVTQILCKNANNLKSSFGRSVG